MTGRRPASGPIAACAALLAILFMAGGALAAGSRDILLEIVSNCVAPPDAAQSNADYCSRCPWPRKDAGCGPAPACRKSTEVWTLGENYVALRDIKMCGCPTGFVHGLALPRNPVRGVEDPSRPDGIWQFAWTATGGRIDAGSLALVVNPARRRSQDQLHVHILRLKEDARPRLAGILAGRADKLDEVWQIAARDAASRGLDDYGVLVARDADGRFAVAVTPDSPEAAFTESVCR